MSDRALASGLYLFAYDAGGLVGGLVLGRIVDGFGWTVIVFALVLARIAAIRLVEPEEQRAW